MSVKSKNCRVKFWLAMAVFVFLSVPLFAYDGLLAGGHDGNFTRYNWIQQASSLDLAQSIVDSFRGEHSVDKLFSIGEDDVDMEDVQVINDTAEYIQNNFRVDNGDAYSFIVKRGDLSGGWDGWVLLSHYSTSQGWLHYLYYFSLSGVGVSPSPSTSQDFEINGTTLVNYRGNAANVTIPAGVTTIGEMAFFKNHILIGLTIPADVISIGHWAFAQCENLTTVTIPASVTSIGVGAFGYCYGLTNITVDTANPNYSSERGILYNKAKTTLITYPSVRGAVTISASVNSIASFAFDQCTNLTGITIPVSVTYIGAAAFQLCTGLRNITIPASVTSIGVGAFWGWTPLQTINVQGKANQAVADVELGSGWRDGCNARIIYSQW